MESIRLARWDASADVPKCCVGTLAVFEALNAARVLSRSRTSAGRGREEERLPAEVGLPPGDAAENASESFEGDEAADRNALERGTRRPGECAGVATPDMVLVVIRGGVAGSGLLIRAVSAGGGVTGRFSVAPATNMERFSVASALTLASVRDDGPVFKSELIGEPTRLGSSKRLIITFRLRCLCAPVFALPPPSIALRCSRFSELGSSFGKDREVRILPLLSLRSTVPSDAVEDTRDAVLC